MAIHREAITDKVLRTGELPAYSFVPPGPGNYGEPQYVEWKDTPYEERVEAAKARLTGAGYGPEQPMSLPLRHNTPATHNPITSGGQGRGNATGVNAERGK